MMKMESKPLLQIALDTIKLDEALRITDLVQEHVDIIEIGTVLLKKEGVSVIQKIKTTYPEKWVFADTKTIDFGKIEARLAFEAGADMMSVCGIASDTTIDHTLREAHIRQKKVVIDLIGLGNSYRQVKRLSYLHPDYLTIQSRDDERATSNDLFEQVEVISQISPIPLAIAGGVQLDDIPYLLVFNPAIIVVGAAITRTSQPAEVAKRFRQSIETPPF
jgi:3-hexulose-6-phosphate synthase